MKLESILNLRKTTVEFPNNNEKFLFKNKILLMLIDKYLTCDIDILV